MQPTLLLALAATLFFDDEYTERPRPIFDGRSLAGFVGRPQLDPAEEGKWSAEERAKKQAEWNADLAQHWKVVDGVIVNDGNGVYLTTAESFRDFDFFVEWKQSALSDSGLYLKNVPQVQIWDTRKEGGKWELGADKGSGGLWNNERFERFPTNLMDRPIGEWNSFRVVQIGARTTVWFNDTRVVDHVVMENYFDRTSPLPVSGPIQLQTHGGEMQFRGVAVRPISPEEASAVLSTHDSAGFEPIFNGKDFTGWKGPVDGYEVLPDGILRCRADSGGTIFTEREYSDFVARVEFRLPKGGNNGLAIRYPGQGDAAYDGMCEVQVLDDPDERYKDIQPWQACGSVYGQIAAKRGYLRPVGEWNFYEVTVKGTTIRVELNGSIISDGDLSKITPPSHKEHPGRLSTKGHFGLCGHSDPVEYRNLRIREIR